MADKKSFILYTDSIDIVEFLPDEEAGQLFKALMAHANGIEVGPMPAGATVAFMSMSKQIDRDNAKYESKCEANKINGKKGGRPPITERLSDKPNITERLLEEPSITQTNPTEPNITLNDTDTVTDTVTDTDTGTDTGTGTDTDNTKVKGVPPKGEPAPQINYQNILDTYNAICVSYPRITKLSEARRKAIKARLNQYKEEDFTTLFEKAEASTFLKGGNNRNWTATFDWMTKDANFAKVIDGNYDSSSGNGQPQKGTQQYNSNPFLAMLAEEEEKMRKEGEP